MRLFAQLCQIGFRCPHHSLSDDCDDLCIHPYTRENCPADELFGLLDDVCECPLVKEGSELEDIISALHYNWDEFFEFVKIQNKRWVREYRHHQCTLDFYERMAMRALPSFWMMLDAVESQNPADSADALGSTNHSQTSKEDTQ